MKYINLKITILGISLVPALLLSPVLLSRSISSAIELPNRHDIIKDLIEINIGQSDAEKAVAHLYTYIPAGISLFSKVYPNIAHFIAHNGLEIGCEVGVAWAGLSVYLLQNVSSLKQLVCIDPYLLPHPNKQSMWNDCSEALYFLAKRHISMAPMSDRATLLRETSLHAVGKFPDEYFDFVYVDGDHSYSAVKADLNAWWKKVKKGGYIIGDDYSNIRSVSVAVQEFVQEHGLLLELINDSKMTYVIKKIAKTI